MPDGRRQFPVPLGPSWPLPSREQASSLLRIGYPNSPKGRSVAAVTSARWGGQALKGEAVIRSPLQGGADLGASPHRPGDRRLLGDLGQPGPLLVPNGEGPVSAPAVVGRLVGDQPMPPGLEIDVVAVGPMVAVASATFSASRSGSVVAITAAPGSRAPGGSAPTTAAPVAPAGCGRPRRGNRRAPSGPGSWPAA